MLFESFCGAGLHSGRSTTLRLPDADHGRHPRLENIFTILNEDLDPKYLVVAFVGALDIAGRELADIAMCEILP